MWYKELGFSSYPLDPRSNPDLVGVDHIEQKVREYIEQGNMCLLCGFTGSGKTSMLNKLSQAEDLKKFRFVMISADGVKKDYDINDAIWDSQNFVNKLLRRKPRNLIVLLDECHLANRILTESIKSKWNHQYENGDKAIQSVVVSQIEDRLGTNFSGSFSDRLGKRIVRMPKLSAEQLHEVLRTRLVQGSKNFVDVFEPEALTFLIDNADGSVRQMLEYADAVFTHHHEVEGDNPLLREDYTISKEVIFNVLQSASLISADRFAKKESFQKIRETPRLNNAVEMFLQFGALSAVNLAEKLNSEHDSAKKIIADLEEASALVYAHSDEGRDFYVLSPRLQHELTRA